MPVPDESPTTLFQRALKISPVLADRLAIEGFTAIEQVAYVPLEEMLEASGLDSEAAQELRRVAKLYLLTEDLKRWD